MNNTPKKATLFILFTFLFSWLLVGGYYLFGGRLSSPSAILVLSIYMFMPAIATIIIQKLIYKEPVMEPLDVSFKLNRWFLVAWLLPPIVAIASFGVSLLLPGIEFSPGMEGFYERLASSLTPEQIAQVKESATALPLHPFWISLFSGLVAGITINAVFGFGEELGWRGLLQKELSFMGFWKSSLFIGLIWGIWHAPIIAQGYNYPQHPFIGIFMMTIWTILLSPIFGYVRLKAKSVIAAAVIHGSLNATFGLSIMLVKGGNDLIISGMGLAGFIVLVFVNLGILLYDRVISKEPKTC